MGTLSKAVRVVAHVMAWCVLAAIVLGILFAGLGAIAAPVSYTHLTLPTIYSV